MDLSRKFCLWVGEVSGVLLFIHGFQAGVFFASLMFIATTLSLYGEFFLFNTPLSFETWIVSVLVLIPSFLFFLALSHDYYVKYKKTEE